MNYRRHDTGETFCDFSLEPLYSRVCLPLQYLVSSMLIAPMQVKERACPIARTDLQKVLYDGAKPGTVQLNRQVVDYTATDSGIKVSFADGSTEEGDFLVIADGTHSRLRNKICGQDIERKYVGYINFNAAVPQSAVKGTLDPVTWTQFVGDGKRVSMMPMSEDRFYVFFDCTLPKGTAANPEGVKPELKHYFAGWHESVQLLIDNLDSKAIARVEIHDTDTLPTLIDPSGRAVLIGDAAHATAPDLGQGGCLAMEDAFVIANLIKQGGLAGPQQDPPSPAKLRAVCEKYQQQRGDRVGETVLRARKRAAITHALEGFDQTNEWYAELKVEDGTHIMDGMAKTILGAPKELNINSSSQPIAKDGKNQLLTEIADSA